MAAAQPVRSGIDFSAFRDPKLARELIERIRELVGDRAINLMEVCGTHTVSIGRYGFRSIMPAGLKLLSGPGCPVCVTANRDIDHAIALASRRQHRDRLFCQPARRRLTGVTRLLVTPASATIN